MVNLTTECSILYSKGCKNDNLHRLSLFMCLRHPYLVLFFYLVLLVDLICNLYEITFFWVKLLSYIDFCDWHHSPINTLEVTDFERRIWLKIVSYLRKWKDKKQRRNIFALCYIVQELWAFESSYILVILFIFSQRKYNPVLQFTTSDPTTTWKCKRLLIQPPSTLPPSTLQPVNLAGYFNHFM